MTDLLTRLEGLSAPCRETDAMIAVEIGFDPDFGYSARELHKSYGGNNDYADIGAHWTALPAYTASIDSAMTLVPEGWERVEFGCYENHDGKFWASLTGQAFLIDSQDAATPAIALCICALRARKGHIEAQGGRDAQ